MKQQLLEGINAAHIYDFLRSFKEELPSTDMLDTKSTRKFRNEVLRVVLSGQKTAPPNKTIMDIIGLEETKSRIQQSLDLLDRQYDFNQLYCL